MIKEILKRQEKNYENFLYNLLLDIKDLKFSKSVGCIEERITYFGKYEKIYIIYTFRKLDTIILENNKFTLRFSTFILNKESKKIINNLYQKYFGDAK